MLPSEKLAELGLELPAVATPVAAYVPAVIDRSVVRTSGQIPVVNGEPVCIGAVGEDGADPEDAKNAARVCALNALAAAASPSTSRSPAWHRFPTTRPWLARRTTTRSACGSRSWSRPRTTSRAAERSRFFADVGTSRCGAGSVAFPRGSAPGLRAETR